MEIGPTWEMDTFPLILRGCKNAVRFVRVWLQGVPQGNPLAYWGNMGSLRHVAGNISYEKSPSAIPGLKKSKSKLAGGPRIGMGVALLPREVAHVHVEQGSRGDGVCAP